MVLALVLGVICSVMACALAAYQIGMHLKYYNSPPFQRYIIRIIFMVPVYAVCSVTTLADPKNAVIVSTVRDCYEAFILYNFHSLCLLYVGGPGEIETGAQGQVVEPSWMLMTCCFPALPVDGKLLRQCKQATLQFVLAKPFLAAAIIVLESYDEYSEGDFSPAKGYVYVMVVMNVCYAVALYGLIVFYLAAQDLLRPYKPVVKFVLIKGVIFFTFWQGFVLSLLVSCGVISTAEEANEIQNCLICVEMFAASVGTLYAFPHNQYIVHDSKSLNVTNLGGKISHAISFTDVVSDTFHQFAPAYHDYTLYAESDAASPGRKQQKGGYRMKTFVFKDLETAEAQLRAGQEARMGGALLHRDSIADNALLMQEAVRAGGGGGGGENKGVGVVGGGGVEGGGAAVVPVVEEEGEEGGGDGMEGSDSEDNGRIV
ncbi:subunit alpha of organic solute transporter [Chloropicon roscoffensis]|uniref:Subunit alpha of organic solute transporter n=1 Tax=Chloropicon roscoffensis TaxID=1461544 RepID=A0AAX4PG91_9CHLO